LDSKEDRQQIGSIDTDSQKDSQQENPDIEPVATVETVYTVETAIESVEAVTDTVEAVTDTVESVDETDTSPLPNQETVETADTVEPDLTVEPVTGEAVTIKPWYTIDDLLDCHYPGWPETKEGLRKKAKREHWPKRTRRGSKGNPYEYQAVLPD
jgi:Asp-tRNA(Asn)/Glu-tRNA(Gln) amidotransferase C subunit